MILVSSEANIGHQMRKFSSQVNCRFAASRIRHLQQKMFNIFTKILLR